MGRLARSASIFEAAQVFPRFPEAEVPAGVPLGQSRNSGGRPSRRTAATPSSATVTPCAATNKADRSELETGNNRFSKLSAALGCGDCGTVGLGRVRCCCFSPAGQAQRAGVVLCSGEVWLNWLVTVNQDCGTHLLNGDVRWICSWCSTDSSWHFTWVAYGVADVLVGHVRGLTDVRYQSVGGT